MQFSLDTGEPMIRQREGNNEFGFYNTLKLLDFSSSVAEVGYQIC